MDGNATFWDCEAWGPAAENIAESLTKGARVLVLGVIRTEVYTPVGSDTERRHLKVVVDDIGPSLRFTTATLQRRGEPGHPGTREDAEARLHSVPPTT
jgi:single-strand DNA-binding protein